MLATCCDGLPAYGWSPIRVLTGPDACSYVDRNHRIGLKCTRGTVGDYSCLESSLKSSNFIEIILISNDLYEVELC